MAHHIKVECNRSQYEIIPLSKGLYHSWFTWDLILLGLTRNIVPKNKLKAAAHWSVVSYPNKFSVFERKKNWSDGMPNDLSGRSLSDSG